MLRRTRLLFVGDSVTAGFGLVSASSLPDASFSEASFSSASFPEAAYPQLVAARLADRGLEVDVEVDALDGADSAYVLKRFDRMVTSHDPDWVVVALGLNDARPPRSMPAKLGGSSHRAARTPADFAANLLAIVDRLLAIGARPVLQSPTPRFDVDHSDAALPRSDGGSPADRGGLMAPYVAAVRDLAEQLRLPLIDVYHALLTESDLPELIPDGVHAGKRGHALIADVVTEELIALLGSSDDLRARSSQKGATPGSSAIGPRSSNRKASR